MKDIGFEVCKIESYGWEVEIDDLIPDRREYRAAQSGFKTLWRPTIEQTLKDVENIVKARKEQTSVPF